MQLSREELSKLDLIIERYVDDTTSKEAVAIETYLNKIDSLERELLIAVYFNFSRKATDEENKIINEHKVKLFSLLSDKGYIKVKTQPRVEQRLNNDKKQKLNRYRALTEQLYRLYDLVEELQEKQHSKSHVQTMDYTKVKITCSRTNYDFTGTNLLAKIQDTENKISKLKIAIEKEREYLSSVIDQIEDIRIRYIFWWRYYMLEEWQKVARLVGLKSERYCMKLHNEYLEKLDI
ncbi:hypothetical protein [Gemella haemolysans]|uniref:Uncharacterized protein n=2 Tax=Gemella haemolysans TaxID=1379 RepID=A0AA87DQM3_9BACL|nr:hypothetical protein [Gemella haemolysans]EGF87042.1 hypothetical protein HMPREF0428_01412 [Gemella haemolysans M341]QIX88874.1 hypothetical protein FOC48_08940 [Gemella haemolysans]